MPVKGYRTYAMAGGIILHQALKLMGIDVESEQLSMAIDTILGVGALIFRKLA